MTVWYSIYTTNLFSSLLSLDRQRARGNGQSRRLGQVRVDRTCYVRVIAIPRGGGKDGEKGVVCYKNGMWFQHWIFIGREDITSRFDNVICPVIDFIFLLLILLMLLLLYELLMMLLMLLIFLLSSLMLILLWLFSLLLILTWLLLLYFCHCVCFDGSLVCSSTW